MSKYHVRYTNEQLIEQIQSYVLTHGKLPTSSIMNAPNSGLATTMVFRSRFGTLSNAFKLMGYTASRADPYPPIKLQCTQCGRDITVNYSTFTKSKTKKFFCNSSCSAIHNNKLRVPRSTESKNKSSIRIKQLFEDGLISIIHKPVRLYYEGPHTKIYGPYTCKSCSRSYWGTRLHQKCCSVVCRDNIRAKNATNITRIPYFNIHTNTIEILQSSWEVTTARWLDEHQIDWHHPTTRIKWYDTTLAKYRTYLPDFYLPQYNTYLDVKNPICHNANLDKYNQLQQLLPLYIGDIQYIQQQVSKLISL